MPTETNPANDQKITFDEAQQARVNELIREAQGRAARETREELAREKQRAEQAATELAEAKAALDKAKGKGESGEDVAVLKAQFSELKTRYDSETERYRQLASNKEKETADARKEVLSIRKQNALQTAAGKIGFVDPADICALTEKHVEYDDQRNDFIIVDDKGIERLNNEMKPMTLDEFYLEYATKKPYTVRGDVKPGTGSTEARRGFRPQYELKELFGKESDSGKANRLALQDRAQYLRLRQEAKEKGLI